MARKQLSLSGRCSVCASSIVQKTFLSEIEAEA